MALVVLSAAEEEKRAEESQTAEDANLDESKTVEKRGASGYGHHHGYHEEKTLTIVKKIPVPYKVEKTVHVPVEKIVKVPHKVYVDKPYPVEKVQFFCL